MALQQHVMRDVRLKLGGMLPEARISYLTLGQLAADGRNGVLMTHGYTSGPEFILGEAGASEGSWGEIVGPGKPIDTTRFFVVSSNMLGSSFGSTNAAAIDPATGQPYGSRFPDLTVEDIVACQRDLLEKLGVRHLVAVVGPSYGGFQAFQWAVSHPNFMDGIAAVVTAPKLPPARLGPLLERLGRDPNWNGGDYYDRGGMVDTLTAIRMDTLRGYGAEAQLADRFPDPQAREAELRRMARTWAERFDANSLVILRKALGHFDVERDFSRIRAKVLYVLSTTDTLFPPTLASPVMEKLRAAGVDARYFQLESPYGHLASGRDAGKWAPVLREFIGGLNPLITDQ